MNQDFNIEKSLHPENYEDNVTQEGHELIDVLEDTVSDLDTFSANHGDLFDAQIYRLQDLVRELRQQLK